MLDTIYVGGFLILSALVMLICLLRQKILLRGFIFSAATGLCGLFAVSLLSGVMQLGVTFNLLSGAVSVLYGLPGVVGMLVLRLISG